MTDKAVCKFTCTGITTHSWPGKTVTMATVYDPHLPEDQRFHTSTPSGEMEMLIANPALEGFFEPGKSYYVVIEKVAEEK